MMDCVCDYGGGSPKHRRWRTLAVFAHTLSCSGRVVARAAAGRATPEHVDAVIERWCTHTFRLSRACLERSGHEGLGAPCVLVSNHHSLMDIPAICASFPGRVRFVAKAELRSIPGFGRAMQEAGIVFVERSNRSAAIASLDRAWEQVGPRTSLWIAAEGGRTDPGSVGTLKKGPFHVAIAGGVPIVPVWIEGAGDVLPANQLMCTTDQRVTVRYGIPISTNGLDVDRLVEQVSAALVDLREGKT